MRAMQMPVLQKTAFWEMTLGRLQEGTAPILRFLILGTSGQRPFQAILVTAKKEGNNE
jgi:hypothetical protein